MSYVPLQFRSADLVDGATKPRILRRWHRILAAGLLIDAAVAVAVFGPMAVRALF